MQFSASAASAAAASAAAAAAAGAGAGAGGGGGGGREGGEEEDSGSLSLPFTPLAAFCPASGQQVVFAPRSSSSSSSKSVASLTIHAPVLLHWGLEFESIRELLVTWHSIFMDLDSHMQSPASTSPARHAAFVRSTSQRYRAEMEAAIWRSANALEQAQLQEQESRFSNVRKGKGAGAGAGAGYGSGSEGMAPQQQEEEEEEEEEEEGVAGEASRLAQVGVSMVQFHNHLQVVEGAKSIWHLFEIFHLDPHENVTAQMADWLQRCVPMPYVPPYTNLGSVGRDDEAEQHAEWWDAVHHLVLQGRVLEAVELLHGNEILLQVSPIATTQAAVLLSSLPSLTHRQGSLDEFVMNFEDWQARARELLEIDEVQLNPPLDRLINIMCGNTSTLAELADSWYELLVAHLLFVRPQMMKDELPWLVQTCLKSLQQRDNSAGDDDDAAVGLPEMTAMDKCRKAIIEGDVQLALQLCQQVLELPWFLAHLTDMLDAAGVISELRLDVLQDANGRGLRESHLASFVESIIGHGHPLWRIGVDYAASCPVSGRRLLTTLVMSVRPTTNRVLLKLLSICDKHNLQHARLSLCKGKAIQALRRGQHGAAVHWFGLIGDTEAIAAVCSRLMDSLLGLDEDSKQQSVADDNVLGLNISDEDKLRALESVVDHLQVNGASGPLGTELVFLGKYRDLRVIMQEMQDMRQHFARDPSAVDVPAYLSEMYQYRRASMEILVRLLLFRVAPPRYWPVLLQHLIPLLQDAAEDQQPLLSVEDTFRLMGCVEELALSHRHSGAETSLSCNGATPPNDKLASVRLALTQHLARAIPQQQEARVSGGFQHAKESIVAGSAQL